MAVTMDATWESRTGKTNTWPTARNAHTCPVRSTTPRKKIVWSARVIRAFFHQGWFGSARPATAATPADHAHA